VKARGLIYTILSLHPRATRLKAAKVRRIRPVRPSRAAEHQYRVALRNQVVVRCKRMGDDVLHGMRPHWHGMHDAVAPGLDALIAQAASTFGDIEHLADRLARAAAMKTLAGADEQLAKNLERAVGVDISGYLAPDHEIGVALRGAVATNVDLIKSIPTQYIERVKVAVERSFADGARWETLAKEIARIGDVTDRRARLIARDQTSKMNAAFNRVRQTGVGIKSYRWSGALDKRERPSHRGLEGTVHPWASPPIVDGEAANPGEPINCRCVPIPEIDLSELAPNGGVYQEAA
jgi:SPP1 gp7 family putative phage head morphogenesis protein